MADQLTKKPKPSKLKLRPANSISLGSSALHKSATPRVSGSSSYLSNLAFDYVREIAQGISQGFLDDQREKIQHAAPGYQAHGTFQPEADDPTMTASRRERHRQNIFSDDEPPSIRRPHNSRRDLSTSDSYALRSSIFTVSIFILAFVIFICVYAVYLACGWRQLF